MTTWPKLLLSNMVALLLGISLMFAFAPFELFPLAVIALAGLLALILNVSPQRSFWLGFIFGVGLFATSIYWIYISVHYIGAVPNYLAALSVCLISFLFALYPAATCYLTTRYFPAVNNAKMIFAFPACWVLLEWARSWLFSGFPWFFIGYTQTNSPLKGYAPILSVYGVSLAVAVTSALIVKAAVSYRGKEYKSVYLSLFAISIVWIAGSLLSLIPWTKPAGAPISVSLVQGNIPQSMKWSPEHLQLSLDRYAGLTQPLWGKSKLIIWPEAAVPLSLQNAEGFIEKLDEKARATGTQLVLGIPIKSPTDEGFYNGVITLGATKKTYLKRQLVPFGEYVPLQQAFAPLFTALDLPMSISIPGKHVQKPLELGDVKLLTSVCFEIAFPELINTHDGSKSVLLTVTNDAWFGKSTEQRQHLQLAQMRAIELGRPVLVASNDGVTAIIDPHGNIQAAAPAHATTVLNGSVQPTSGLTPWMKNGMDPMLLILTVMIITAVRSNKRTAKMAARLEAKPLATDNKLN